MGAALTIAIRITNSANAILQHVKAFNKEGLRNNEEWAMPSHIGINPMLLALSMELALKAWFVFDYDTPEVARSHNLQKLFARLKPESQNRLDSEFRQSVAPLHPDLLYIDYGIRNVLEQHENAFVDWRYIHEAKHLQFDESAFTATLEMVLSEFKKRYRIEEKPSFWPSE